MGHGALSDAREIDPKRPRASKIVDPWRTFDKGDELLAHTLVSHGQSNRAELLNSLHACL